MADYTRKQLDVDGSYVFPYTHADAVLYTTQNNLDGITSGTETNVKAVLDALDNTYRRLDSNILSLYNPSGKRGFLYLNGTTTTASMELPTLGNDFYIPTLKYDSNGNITTAWLTPASIAAITDLSGYLSLTGGTLTGDITVDKSSYTVLTGNAVVNGLTAKANNITVGYGIGTGGVSRGIYDYNNSKWLIYSDGTNTNLPLGNVNISGDTKVTGKVMVGTGGTNSYLASDTANNIYLRNSSGAVLVCDSLAVRRGASVANATLGNSTYPWLALYATTVYENGTSLASKYLALSGGTMTGAIIASVNAANAFDTNEGINIGSGSHIGYSTGLGIYSNGEIWIRPALNIPTSSDTTKGLKISGTVFTYNNTNVSLEGHTHSEYLSTTGTAAKATSLAGGALGSIPYQSAAGTTTFLAAGTNGYILAYNTTNNAPEWVAKPTSNVSTSAVVSSSATGTAQITAALTNPYYNLVEGSTVARSIRFVAGAGISISAATDGQITITNTIGSSATISSILSSTSTGTSAIEGDTLNPYYNLLVNSAVSSSVQFKAGTNMAVTADTNNGITFNNTLTKMSQLTNNLFINGTQTATTGSWKGKLPAEITSLYDGLTIFYRLPYAGSGNASLQLYAQDGTTAIGANCPVYGGNTRLTTHYPLYSIIPMTYYNGEWRANPYYNTNNNVTLTNSTSTDYRAVLMGSQSNASIGAVPSGATTAGTYKSSNFVYSPGGGRLYIRTSSTSGQHGYYVASTVSDAGYAVGLVMLSDLISRGIRDTYNGKWLWYMDDTTGDTVKTDATVLIDSGIVKLSANCLIAYDSTNQCINFTFI